MSLEFSSAVVHCCPKCGSRTGLIYAPSFAKPMNCRVCLKERNPEGYRRLVEKERVADSALNERIAEALADLKKPLEQRQIERGFCYWSPAWARVRTEQLPRRRIFNADL